MNETTKLKSAISMPTDFKFGQVPSALKVRDLMASPPDLGPLKAFTGTWTGNGFNTIFRPDNSATPTPLPIQVSSDNILELNLTSETLSFSDSLGSVPNRGTNPQGDIFLNGIPYLQSISDVTNPPQKVGIHLEPGLWVIVPSTSSPAEGQTIVRMASIPHGTTIQAQGTSTIINGPPIIPAININPFGIGGTQPPAAPPPGNRQFASQTAATAGTPRIPQDLTSFIAAGTITQTMLDNPNSVLANIISHQKIISTTQISVSTNAAPAIPGGGTDNIAFLQGGPTSGPNAQSFMMAATFWIETIEHTIIVPPFQVGQPPLSIRPEPRAPLQPVPTFTVHPPINIPTPRPITFTTQQIQYSQIVMLNFNTLTWPHVSVATLVPSEPILIPPSVWS